MKSLVKYLENYLVVAIPFVAVCMVWSSFNSGGSVAPESGFLVRALWEVLSWNVIAWFGALVLYVTMLVFVGAVRERVLKRLANIKERDEREVAITGQASRAAYISTLALLLFLLFFSIFTVSVYRVPADQAVNGKTGSISFGLNFQFLDSGKVVADSSTNQVIFETKDLPVSKTGLLMIVILWQLVAFKLSARRQVTGEEAA